MELFSVQSRNPESVLIYAEGQVWNSMGCGRGSAELQPGHGTATVFCWPIFEMWRWIQLHIGSCWNITSIVVHFLEKKDPDILGFARSCIETMRALGKQY